MKYTTVVLKFEGNETVKEVYRLQMNDLKTTVNTIKDKYQLRMIELEVRNLLAIVQQNQANMAMLEIN